jgi:predicted component of type VI protein secretion system
MRHMLLVALVSTFAAACASNKASDEPGTRIRDTILTTQDTTNPNDTLPHIRDSMPDSTQR